MRRFLVVVMLVAVAVLFGARWLIDSIHDDRFAFEQSLTPAQKARAGKTVGDFAQMPRLSLVEYKKADDGGRTTLGLVGRKDDSGVWLHFSLTTKPVYSKCNNLYDTRYISRIILPTDPDYKDKLVEFVHQE